MNICLYGASSTEIAQEYIIATEELGELLAREGCSLVYGAGGAGLMGAAARGMKRGGGYVVGVVPSFLKVDGILFDGCDEMIFTDTMRQRKQIMEERADAFIVAPGGIGTYEEFFEIYTLKQLGQLNKPIVVFNINGYFNEMLAMLRRTVDERFMREASMELIKVGDTPRAILDCIAKASSVESVDIRATKFV